MELEQVQNFYSEYLEYREDKKLREEYELLLHWAKDLELDSYFELVDENDFRNRGGANIDDLISSLEKDPFGLETDTDARKKRCRNSKLPRMILAQTWLSLCLWWRLFDILRINLKKK